MAICRLNLGVMLANAHRYGEALDAWREADRTYSSLVGADSENARIARSGTAFAQTKFGRLGEADAIFVALLERPYRSNAEEVLVKRRLGVLRSVQGRHREALKLLREVADAVVDAPDRSRALALAALGDALVAAGKMADALPLLQQARHSCFAVSQTDPRTSPTWPLTLHARRSHLVAAKKPLRLRTRPQRSGSGLLRSGRRLESPCSGRHAHWPQPAGHRRRPLSCARRQALSARRGTAADQALLEQTRRAIRVPSTAGG